MSLTAPVSLYQIRKSLVKFEIIYLKISFRPTCVPIPRRFIRSTYDCSGDLGGSFQLVGSFDTDARSSIYAETQTRGIVHLMQASKT
jgi:hypothetical protein